MDGKNNVRPSASQIDMTSNNLLITNGVVREKIVFKSKELLIERKWSGNNSRINKPYMLKNVSKMLHLEKKVAVRQACNFYSQFVAQRTKILHNKLGAKKGPERKYSFFIITCDKHIIKHIEKGALDHILWRSKIV